MKDVTIACHDRHLTINVAQFLDMIGDQKTRDALVHLLALAEDRFDVAREIHNRRDGTEKVPAIKEIRARSFCSLYEAKEAADSMPRWSPVRWDD